MLCGRQSAHPAFRRAGLTFIPTGTIAPVGHPSRTRCRPDLVAVRQNTDTESTPRPTPMLPASDVTASDAVRAPTSVRWHDLESVVAFYSKGKSVAANIEQALAYTGYLLAARPDRVAMLGLYLGPTGFVVLLSNPSGAFRTALIPWDQQSINPLLAKVVNFIEHPPKSMVDATTVWKDNNTFDITIGTRVYRGCKLAWSPARGRWTSVFKTGGEVIKSQYRNCTSEPEAVVLEHIHTPYAFPGVVRVGEYGWVKRADGSFVEYTWKGQRRRKVVMALKDEGIPFMEIQTPYEALATIWDLLEGEPSLPH